MPVLLITGCAPIITHGPDVHPGFSGGASAAIGDGPTYENGDDPGPFYIGAAIVNVAYGVRAKSDSRPSFRFGLQGPTIDAVALDLFVQAPRKWLRPVSAGAGFMGEFSDGRRMPYVQTGIRSAEGFGLNAAVSRYKDARRNRMEKAQVNWLSFEAPLTKFAALHFHFGYASAHVTKWIRLDETPYIDEDRWVKLGGATLELHH
ncbi:MAG TPA: hypothetical protein VF042_16410 [Gemmatimonadaceae bacterium]